MTIGVIFLIFDTIFVLTTRGDCRCKAAAPLTFIDVYSYKNWSQTVLPLIVISIEK